MRLQWSPLRSPTVAAGNTACDKKSGVILTMWQFTRQSLSELIKHKLARLGCLFTIALMMIGATALTRLVLGWFRYDETQKEALSKSIGEYFGKGLLGLVVLLGFIMMGRQLVAELRSKRSQPPTIPSPPLGLSPEVERLASTPNGKIEAIKLYREQNAGVSLAEAKAKIEAFCKANCKHESPEPRV